MSALQIGSTHMDLFASIGAFHGAASGFNAATSYGGAYANADDVNKKMCVIFLGAGVASLTLAMIQKLHAGLGIPAESLLRQTVLAPAPR